MIFFSMQKFKNVANLTKRMSLVCLKWLRKLNGLLFFSARNVRKLLQLIFGAFIFHESLCGFLFHGFLVQIDDISMLYFFNIKVFHLSAKHYFYSISKKNFIFLLDVIMRHFMHAKKRWGKRKFVENKLLVSSLVLITVIIHD